MVVTSHPIPSCTHRQRAPAPCTMCALAAVALRREVVVAGAANGSSIMLAGDRLNTLAIANGYLYSVDAAGTTQWMHASLTHTHRLCREGGRVSSLGMASEFNLITAFHRRSATGAGGQPERERERESGH